MSLLFQVTARPVSALPAESRGTAVSCTICPRRGLALAGLTVTDATGTSLTLIVAVALCPSTAAVIVAVPTAFAATNPPESTEAMIVSLLFQVTARPVSALPAESRGTAVSCTICARRGLALAGLTVTDATGRSLTVTVALSSN